MDVFLHALGLLRIKAYHAAVAEMRADYDASFVRLRDAARTARVGARAVAEENARLRNENASLKGQIVALNHAARRPAAHIVPSD